MNLFELAAVLTLNKKDYDKGVNDAMKSAEGLAGKLGGAAKTIASGTINAVKTVSKLTLAATGAAAAGVATLVKKSVAEYGEYEQLIGGIQKLYGTTAQSAEEYAKATGMSIEAATEKYNELKDAQNTITANAKTAWQTVGMSVNDYMQNATALSSALIKSLDGDTKKAADLVDVAMRDIADNANTYGSYTVEELSQVYSALARGSYMTLDNLRLGYAGTKSGMEELIADANKLKEANGEMADLTIDKYADIIEAIHLVQTANHVSGLSAAEAAQAVAEGLMTEEEAYQKMGTTAREASTTLQGSMTQAKAAIDNLIAGLSDKDADINQLVENVIYSAGLYVKNIVPVVENALTSIGPALKQVFPSLIDLVTSTMTDALPQLADAAIELVNQVILAVGSSGDKIVNAFNKILSLVIDKLSGDTLGNALVNMIKSLMSTLTGAITKNATKLFPALAETLTAIVEQLTSPIMSKQMMRAGGEMLKALLNGLIKGAGILLEAAPEIISNLVYMVSNGVTIVSRALTDSLGKIDLGKLFSADSLGGVLEDITGLLLKIGQKIAETAPQVLGGIMNAVTGLLSSMMDSGTLNELITGSIDNIVKLVAGIVETLTNPDTFGTLLDAGATIITSLLEGLTTSLPMLLPVVMQAIETIATTLTEPDRLSMILNPALTLITTLGEGLIEVIPDLIPIAAQVITNLVEFVTDPKNLANIINAAVDILFALGNGLISSVGQLLPAVVKIIWSLVNALLDPEILIQLVNVGIHFIAELVEGFVKAIPDFLALAPDLIFEMASGLLQIGKQLIDVGVEIIQFIFGGFKSKIEEAKDWGKNLIQGFMNGITEKWNDLKDKVSGMISGIKSWFTGKNGFDEHSPSKWGKQVFAYLIEGAEQGLKAETPSLLKTAQNTVNAVKASLDFTFNKPVSVTTDGSEVETPEFEPIEIKDLGAGIKEEIKSIIDSVKTMLTDGESSVFAALSDYCKTAVNALTQIIKDGMAADGQTLFKMARDNIDAVQKELDMTWTAPVTVTPTEIKPVDNIPEMTESRDIDYDAIISRQIEKNAENKPTEDENSTQDIYDLLKEYLPTLQRLQAISTPALVGMIAPEMDETLGLRQDAAQRRLA